MLQVGWLLGLGDRHLDNILLDGRSGELVHIDYNIVFERGRQLRVPEVVPFRLTPVLAAPLGPAGRPIEAGSFRAAAEAALGALRRHGAQLGELLGANLQDASLDWASGHHDAPQRKVSAHFMPSSTDAIMMEMRLAGNRIRMSGMCFPGNPTKPNRRLCWMPLPNAWCGQLAQDVKGRHLLRTDLIGFL